MMVCRCPSSPPDSKLHEEEGAGSILFSVGEKVVWPKMHNKNVLNI